MTGTSMTTTRSRSRSTATTTSRRLTASCSTSPRFEFEFESESEGERNEPRPRRARDTSGDRAARERERERERERGRRRAQHRDAEREHVGERDAAAASRAGRRSHPSAVVNPETQAAREARDGAGLPTRRPRSRPSCTYACHAATAPRHHHRDHRGDVRRRRARRAVAHAHDGHAARAGRALITIHYDTLHYVTLRCVAHYVQSLGISAHAGWSRAFAVPSHATHTSRLWSPSFVYFCHVSHFCRNHCRTKYSKYHGR